MMKISTQCTWRIPAYVFNYKWFLQQQWKSPSFLQSNRQTVDGQLHVLSLMCMCIFFSFFRVGCCGRLGGCDATPEWAPTGLRSTGPGSTRLSHVCSWQQPELRPPTAGPAAQVSSSSTQLLLNTNTVFSSRKHFCETCDVQHQNS